jgi:hypothetical protein
MHLINVKRLAYGIRPVDIEKALEEYGYPGARMAGAEATAAAPSPLPSLPSLEDKIARFLASRGVASAASSGFEAEPEIPRPSPPPPPVAPLEFVSEVDVRSALNEGRKLPVGPGTLITPSARDLGNENNIFLRV